MNPSILDELENCNMIEVLARILEKERNGPIGNESANQILNAMYNREYSFLLSRHCRTI